MESVSPSLAPTSWFYIGPDENLHGPHTPVAMLEWTKMGYFPEQLLLRTENDDRFYPLKEWIRVCGGRLPFFFPIESWQSALDIFRDAQPIDRAPFLPQPPNAPHPMWIYPTHIPVAPVSAPMHIEGRANGFRIPNGNIDTDQYANIQSAHYRSDQSLNHHDTNGIHTTGESTGSNSPEEHYRMRTRISASNKSVDTVEAPWNVPTHLVHQGTDPFNMPSENSIGTQTEPFIMSRIDVERALSELLGINIKISSP
ncbi:GYF domain-containing protein [Ditylenchus destructor]|uniref:GYF domain-containing protein n=1 Tax=Ditylenchus destructor TaxID=166010 RepID=A0AAD4RBU0_9BILA|nr:GYF domain-containing protein [Ditylenchus destructor]